MYGRCLFFLRDNGAKGGGGRAGKVSQGIAGVACGSFVGGLDEMDVWMGAAWRVGWSARWIG